MARVTKDFSDKAQQCKTLDELKALAQTEGVELSEKDAKEFLEYADDGEIDVATLKKVTGGSEYGFSTSF